LGLQFDLTDGDQFQLNLNRRHGAVADRRSRAA
jgi:hypothetical protein